MQQRKETNTREQKMKRTNAMNFFLKMISNTKQNKTKIIIIRRVKSKLIGFSGNGTKNMLTRQKCYRLANRRANCNKNNRKCTVSKYST